MKSLSGRERDGYASDPLDLAEDSPISNARALSYYPNGGAFLIGGAICGMLVVVVFAGIDFSLAYLVTLAIFAFGGAWFGFLAISAVGEWRIDEAYADAKARRGGS